MRNRLVVFTLVGILAASSAHATSIVLPDDGGRPGLRQSFGPLGNSANVGLTEQFRIAANLLTAFAIGDRINSVGFRLAPDLPTIAYDAVYTRFDIQLSTFIDQGHGLSRVFDDNLGPDTTLVRSGAMTIPGGSLVNTGGTANPFYDITFSQGFAYTGGDLLITIRSKPTDSYSIGLDAVSPAYYPIQTVFSVFDYAKEGSCCDNLNVPYIRLSTAAVPEPATWGMAVVGFGAIGCAMRRHRIGGARMLMA